MKYVDKIMLEKPYPILISPDGLLRIQIGTALFQNPEAENTPSCDLVSRPVTIPFSSEVRGSDTYCEVDRTGVLNILCLQDDTICVDVLNRHLEEVSNSFMAEDFNHSWFIEPLLDEGVILTASPVTEITLPLTYRSKSPDIPKWCTDSYTYYHHREEGKDGIFLYLYSLAEKPDASSTEEIAVDLCRQILAYDRLFFNKTKTFPTYRFTAVEQEHADKVSAIDRCVGRLLAVKRQRVFPEKKVMSDIFDFLELSFHTDEPDVLDTGRLADEYPVLTLTQWDDFLQGMVDFGLWLEWDDDDYIQFRRLPEAGKFKAVHYSAHFFEQWRRRPSETVRSFLKERSHDA